MSIERIEGQSPVRISVTALTALVTEVVASTPVSMGVDGRSELAMSVIGESTIELEDV